MRPLFCAARVCWIMTGWVGYRRLIRARFRQISIGQALGCWLACAISWYVNRPDLAWPLIAIVVSVHVAPLGRLFRVRTYFWTALAGSVVALGSMVGADVSARLMVLGLGMGSVMWISVTHLLSVADDNAEVWAAAATQIYG